MAGRSFQQETRYCPIGFIDNDMGIVTERGERRQLVQADQGLRALTKAGSNNYSRDAKLIREDFRDYFMSDKGQVPWQWSAIHATADCFQNREHDY